jgi:hypothetical protein
MNTVLILVAVVVLVVAPILIFYGAVEYYFATKTVRRELGCDINITGDWVELRPRRSLKPKKHVQSVLIYVESSLKTLSNPLRLHLAEGIYAQPDVELVDEDGQAFRLKPSLYSEHGVGYYTDSRRLRGKKFRVVRVRCNEPFRASKIIWDDTKLK